MEKEMTRPALPYDHTCIADGTQFEMKKYVSDVYKYCVYVFRTA